MRRCRSHLTLLLGAAIALPSANTLAQQGDGTDVVARNSVFKPAPVEPTPERLAELELPEGFELTVFASDLGNPRIIAVAEDGAVYVSRREQGDVLLLRDEDGDGRADGEPLRVAHRPGAHGLAIHDGQLYLATVKEVYRAPIEADGRLGELELLIDDLPDGGQHPNRTIAFGPDGMLYISVGSTCNACNETNPEHATLLRAQPDGSSRTIFASGLRNTIGFGWHPRTGELWGMDHNIDSLGDDTHDEELNRIVNGRQYGWPHVFGEGELHPQTTPPGDIAKETWREMSEPMVLGYTPHAAPMQMAFYGAGRHPSGGNATFPEAYHGDAFVAMRGSWNRKPASGYEVVRVRFEDGEPRAIEPFVSGFLVDGGRGHLARPVGLAVAADGALLLGDDGNGAIYRIAPREAGAALRAVAPPAGPMQAQAKAGSGVPLALQRQGIQPAEGAPQLEVASTAFADQAPIPRRHSDYGEGISPPLRWSAVPGARSYAIVLEDPDARSITPFVHWVAWNIPASVTALPEGLGTEPRLTDPEGMLQGRNSRGSTGYFGPRPPPGDPPHHYHFQVLALDTELEVAPGADRDAVLEAARGHVLAAEELVGTFARASEAPE